MARPSPHTTRLVDEVSMMHGMLRAAMDHAEYLAARAQQAELNRKKANHINNTGSVGAWFERSNRELREFAEQQRKEALSRWDEFIRTRKPGRRASRKPIT